MTSRISSAGELVCQRLLVKAGDGFVPGQHEATIVDPRPHRDRADLAAVLTYVDDAGRACSVVCLRFRDGRGWQAVKLHRAGLRKIEPVTAVGVPKLNGVLWRRSRTLPGLLSRFRSSRLHLTRWHSVA
jgi:hypothetical protein